ncbi:MAG: DUF3970 family protein [Clostridium sp.]|jgi:hypothetical protein
MLKVRICFVDDEEGNIELKRALKKIDEAFDIVSESKKYKNTNGNKYSRLYLDVQNKGE